MATVNFYYRSKKKLAHLTIKLRYSINKKNFVHTAKTPITTYLYIWEKYYHKKITDAQIRDKVFALRAELDKLESYILNSFNELDSGASKKWLEDAINAHFNTSDEVPNNITDYVDYYRDARKNEIEPHHVRKLNSLKDKLVAFDTFQGYSHKLSGINESFKTKFYNYLKSKRYADSTIKKQIDLIAQICRYAGYNGMEISPQVNNFKVKVKKTPKIYLTFDELERIEKLKDHTLNTEKLKATRDWLIISAYTGQRISDFMRFTKDMIRKEKGKTFIDFTQTKTKKHMTIPLHDKVLKILDRNNGNFPKKLLDQKYNDSLKLVCKKAKLINPITGRKSVNIGTKENPVYRYKTDTYPKYKLITSHVGRRSFCTNYYGKIPTTYIMYIAGFSSETMLLKYIGKSNKDLALDVANYF
jgi:integrase